MLTSTVIILGMISLVKDKKEGWNSGEESENQP
jgi:hypothetical protein